MHKTKFMANLTRQSCGDLSWLFACPRDQRPTEHSRMSEKPQKQATAKQPGTFSSDTYVPAWNVNGFTYHVIVQSVSDG